MCYMHLAVCLETLALVNRNLYLLRNVPTGSDVCSAIVLRHVWCVASKEHELSNTTAARLAP